MAPLFDPHSSPFLNGIFAPTQSEIDNTPLELLSGEIPADLSGTYYRNGPNARFAPIGSYTYPLDGDGMVHAVTFRDGSATYRNRYVRTPSMAAEDRAGRALWGGVMTPIMPSAELVGPALAGQYKDLPDVNVMRHAGRLLALAESARPFELTDALDTVGPCYFDGKLPKGVTAHPKLDPETGELVIFRYDMAAPFLTWAIIGRDGHVSHAEEPIEIDGSFMIHDFVITQVSTSSTTPNALMAMRLWNWSRSYRLRETATSGMSPIQMFTLRQQRVDRLRQSRQHNERLRPA
jgi:carotenoid cleavage dioxygenase